MADREKVIRGLESCNGKAIFEARCPFNCPYAVSAGKIWTEPDCCEQLIKDALALLKEQEPRVLEFLEISETTTYWMEDNREANQKTTCIPETIMDIMGDRIFTIPVVKLLNGYAPVISKNREGYGKTWRAWTSRPTEQQMRDTKWEE